MNTLIWPTATTKDGFNRTLVNVRNVFRTVPSESVIVIHSILKSGPIFMDIFLLAEFLPDRDGLEFTLANATLAVPLLAMAIAIAMQAVLQRERLRAG